MSAPGSWPGRVFVCAILWIPAGWTATMLVKLGPLEGPELGPFWTFQSLLDLKKL